MATLNISSDIVTGLYALIFDVLIVWILAKMVKRAVALMTSREIYSKNISVNISEVDLPGGLTPIQLQSRSTIILTAVTAGIPLLFLTAGFAFNGETVRPVSYTGAKLGVELDLSRPNDYYIRNIGIVDGVRASNEHATALVDWDYCTLGASDTFKIYGNYYEEDLSREMRPLSDVILQRPVCLDERLAGDRHILMQVERHTPTQAERCFHGDWIIEGVEEVDVSYEELKELVGSKVTKVNYFRTCDGQREFAMCVKSSCLGLRRSETRLEGELSSSANYSGQNFTAALYNRFAMNLAYEKALNDLDQVLGTAVILSEFSFRTRLSRTISLQFVRLERRTREVLQNERKVTMVNVKLLVAPMVTVAVLALIIAITWTGEKISQLSDGRDRHFDPTSRKGLVSMIYHLQKGNDQCQFKAEDKQKLLVGLVDDVSRLRVTKAVRSQNSSDGLSVMGETINA